jgi:hypothetical protein
MSTLAPNHWWVSCTPFGFLFLIEQATALFPVHLIVGQNLRIQLYLIQSDDLHQNQ